MNARPFVSTPLSPENESVQTVAPAPPAMNAMPPTLPSARADSARADDLENLYPEIYWEVYPLVADIVEKMMADGHAPTPENMGAIVDNIIKNSGLWYEDDDDDLFETNPEAIPVQLGFGRGSFRRRRRRHHSRNTLRDIVRILLLRELFSRRGGFPHRDF